MAQTLKIEKYKDTTSYKTYRIEKYVNIRGKIHEALSYGERDRDLTIWYKLDDIKKTSPNWTIYDVPSHENTRTFEYTKPNTSTKEPIGSTRENPNDSYREGNRGRDRRKNYSNRGSHSRGLRYPSPSQMRP